MPKKPSLSKKESIRKRVPSKKNQMNHALTWFSAGCLAECYLLVIRHFYVEGTPQQLISLYGAFKYIAFAGITTFALGMVLFLVSRKKMGIGRRTGTALLAAGVFFAGSSVLMRQVYPTGTTVLCVVVPIAAVLGLLWSVYDRECSYAITLLSLTELAVWICRRGIDSEYWHFKVIAGAVGYMVALGIVVLIFRYADAHHGKLGGLHLLPSGTDGLSVYFSCGASVIALVFALFSSSIAYYVMWILAVLIFALAVYYTVRLL